MQPIGLTLKTGKVNRYAKEISGEIMLVHYCLACGRISCNRIAGDDNACAVIRLLNEPLEMEPDLMGEISAWNISLLTLSDEDMVTRALFGNAYSSFIE
jgi:hypothetical protein